jgi:hypothetical protein
MAEQVAESEAAKVLDWGEKLSKKLFEVDKDASTKAVQEATPSSQRALAVQLVPAHIY